MTPLDAGSCESIAAFGWLIGVLCGTVLDVALVVAVALTPRLREHGGGPDPIGVAERWLLPLPPFCIAAIWGWGIHEIPWTMVECYVVHTALAATIVIAIVVLVLVGTAANHVARRSIW